MFYGDPAIDALVASDPEFNAVADRLRELVEGPDRGHVDRIAFSVFCSGVGLAAADPDLADIDDADLHRALLELSGRILSPAVAPSQP